MRYGENNPKKLLTTGSEFGTVELFPSRGSFFEISEVRSIGVPSQNLSYTVT